MREAKAKPQYITDLEQEIMTLTPGEQAQVFDYVVELKAIGRKVEQASQELGVPANEILELTFDIFDAMREGRQ